MAAQTVVNGPHRPLANYSPSPSLWGDQFTKYNSDPQVKEKYSREIEALKNEVRSLLTAPESNMVDIMKLIDTVERLGISYHFNNEIEEKIQQFFNLNTNYEDEDYDLYTVALHFRLFRQHGYPISSDVFGKWINGKGELKEIPMGDAKGLLSLYEATYLRRHGETILDDALDFTAANLKAMLPNLGSPLKKQVAHALVQSLHLGGPRIESRHFISIYEEEEQKNETLLRFAKLDYNLVQILHKEELSEVTRWWKKLDLISKLPYARDRVVECYFWTVAVYYEPQYSRARIMLAKVIAITSVLDDTYDSYGLIEELDILTKALERWDIKEIDTLPEYMKVFYKEVLKLHQQFEEELANEGRSYAVFCAREAFKELANSYNVEAKWFIQGYMPPFEEYLSNAFITCAGGYLTLALFLGVESVTKEEFEWLSKKPKIVAAAMVINRVIDDIASYEVEKERGQIATGIECYMKEKGVTKEEAMNKFSELATNAWKDTTEECLNPSSPYSREIFYRILNFDRIVDVSYKDNQDGYTRPEKVLKPHIIALFVDEIKIN
ncbi:hypothetical protein ACS0TY_026578 [Phlomoides rotata]